MQTTIHGSRLLRPALAVLVIGTLAWPLAGCAKDPQQVQIVTGSKVSSGLTPLQRGQIRSESLAAAKKGMDAWLANDVTAMRPYWSPAYVAYYTKRNAEYASKGLIRVRKLDRITTYDVTDMNETGTEVIIDIYFDDGGFVKDPKGVASTKPTNKPTQIQLTVDKVNGAWIITRLIASVAVTE